MAESWLVEDRPPGLVVASDSDDGLPGLASDGLSSGSAVGSSRLPASPPELVSDVSSVSSDEENGWRGERPREHGNGTLQRRPLNVGFVGPQPPAMAARQVGAARGGLDEIDRSDSEQADMLDDMYDTLGHYEEDVDLNGIFDGFGGGLPGGMVPQLEQYVQAMGLNDGLLQHIPVQELLGLVMRNGGDARLGGGGSDMPWPFEGITASTNGGGMMPGAAMAGSRIPQGLDASTWRHAQNMADLGFATALDPARRAACAAEGIPSGRRQASPRAPAYHVPVNSSETAVPAAARATGQQGGGVGRVTSTLGRTLQRVDSASGIGGLQRSDSAASQGSSGSSMLRQAAALALRQGQSRLAGTVTAHATVQPSWGGSEEISEILDTSSDVESGRSVPGLTSVGLGSSSDENAPLQQQQQQGSQAAAGEEGLQPLHRRQRRNAVFGQLPGLGIPLGAAAVQAGAGGSDDALPGPAAYLGSDGSNDERSSRRRGCIRVRRRQGRSGADEPPPPLVLDTGRDSDVDEALPQLQAASGEDEASLPGLAYSGEGGHSIGWEEGLPALVSDGSSGSSGGSGSDEGSDDEQPLPLAESDDGSASDRDSEGPLPRLGAAQSFRPQVPFSRPWPAAIGSTAAATAPVQPPGFTADQRNVMQALTVLLPRQADARGWAELAAYVHHASGGGGSGSGGGVQLLSRLVAAATYHFPAEAETAGLTERPLGPLHPVAGAEAAPAASAVSFNASLVAGAVQQEGEEATEPQVTFVVGSPQAAAQLQQDLGPGVSVVAEGHPPPAWQAPHITLVVGSMQAAADLGRQQLGRGIDVVATEQFLAAEQFIDGILVHHPPGAPLKEDAAAGEAGPSKASGVPVAAAAAAAVNADAATATSGTALPAALAASMRDQSLQLSAASTEVPLRLPTQPGVTAQQPLPPLVAAAAGPNPEQAEE